MMNEKLYVLRFNTDVFEGMYEDLYFKNLERVKEYISEFTHNALDDEYKNPEVTVVSLQTSGFMCLQSGMIILNMLLIF